MSLNGTHSVKIGDSIRKGTKSNLVTFKYDFLPKSLGTNKTGEVVLESDSSITVKFQNQSGNTTDHTFYKGTYEKTSKECVLIVDKKTNEMTLEKIDYVVNLKNHRERANISVNSNVNSNVAIKKKIVTEASLTDSSDDDNITEIRKSPNKNYELKPNVKPVTGNMSHDLFDYDNHMDATSEQEHEPSINYARDDLHLSDTDNDSASGHISEGAADQVMQDIQITDSESGSNADSDSSGSSSSSEEE